MASNFVFLGFAPDSTFVFAGRFAILYHLRVSPLRIFKFAFRLRGYCWLRATCKRPSDFKLCCLHNFAFGHPAAWGPHLPGHTHTIQLALARLPVKSPLESHGLQGPGALRCPFSKVSSFSSGKAVFHNSTTCNFHDCAVKLGCHASTHLALPATLD